MTVRIVTDSTADLPPELIEQLGITVVPVYVRFGQNVFRDGIDISQDEVYCRILSENATATTSQPSPNDFLEYYERLLNGTADQIVSLHLSSKLSGTYNAALGGRELSLHKDQITVVDTLSLSMGLGFCVLAAARLAQAKAELSEIIQAAKETTSLTRISAAFDTLKYVLKSGRLGAAKALIGGILNVKPILTLKDGVLWPSGIARTRQRALDSLVDFANKTSGVEEAAIVYSTTPDEAHTLKERLSEFLDQRMIYISRLGPALGAHGGPGTIVLALKRNLTPSGKTNHP